MFFPLEYFVYDVHIVYCCIHRYSFSIPYRIHDVMAVGLTIALTKKCDFHLRNLLESFLFANRIVIQITLIIRLNQMRV